MNEHKLQLNENIFGNTKVLGKILDTCIEYQYTENQAKYAKTLIQSKFLGSELIKNILNAFDTSVNDVKENKTRNPLFYYYSLHDENLIAVMNLLGIDYGTIIPFASSLFFELREDDTDGKLFVRVYFDDIQLDINVMARENLDSHDNKPPAKSSKYYQNQPYDQIDEESSYYSSIKDYLLNRIFIEDVSSYCDRSIEELVLTGYNTKQHSTSNNEFLMISMFLSLIFVILIITLYAFSRLILPKAHSSQDKNSLPNAQSSFQHQVFMDEY